MADKGWRSFAGEFAGSGDIRFDDFQVAKASLGANSGMLNVSLLTSDLQKAFDGLGPKDIAFREEKLQALRHRLRDQQVRQRKAEEKRKNRDKEMAEAWHKNVKEMKEERAQERQMRLTALQDKQQRIDDVKAERQRAIEEEEARKEAERRAAEQEAERDALECFLTGMGTVKLTDPDPADEEAPPVPKAEPKKKVKPRLPSEATQSRKKKVGDTDGVKINDKTPLIQQLPQLFPGLKRNAEGQQILANAENPEKTFEVPSTTKEHLLRSAQIGVMSSLAAQVSEYRRGMRNRLRPLDVNPSLGLPGLGSPLAFTASAASDAGASCLSGSLTAR